MRKLIIASLALLLVSGITLAQSMQPNNLALEPLNAKIITCHIATTGTADITIPLFIAPCAGYIATRPRMVSTSGTALADTTTALHWEFYILRKDSVATAATDTMARYVTHDTSNMVGTQTTTRAYCPMTALYSYPFHWQSTYRLSTTTPARLVDRNNVIQLRCESVGTTPTAVTNLDVEFVFVPTIRQNAFIR